MKVSGTKVLEAPRERVWAVLNDPAQLAKTLPGVESFSVEDDRHWTATVKVPLGIGGLGLRFAFEKTDARPPEHAALQAKGKGIGAIVSLATEFDLAAEGAGTRMDWLADVRIAGQIGSMGQRVLQPIVNQQVENVLASLERQVAESSAAPQPGERAPEGAEAGVHPGAPEAYSDRPQGPTHSASDER